MTTGERVAQFGETVGVIRGSHESWYDFAACTAPDVNPDWWFPRQGANRDRDRAKAICHSCPVKYECTLKAVKDKEQSGIFGELDVKGRRRWDQEKKAG